MTQNAIKKRISEGRKPVVAQKRPEDDEVNFSDSDTSVGLVKQPVEIEQEKFPKDGKIH